MRCIVSGAPLKPAQSRRLRDWRKNIPKTGFAWKQKLAHFLSASTTVDWVTPWRNKLRQRVPLSPCSLAMGARFAYRTLVVGRGTYDRGSANPNNMVAKLAPKLRPMYWYSTCAATKASRPRRTRPKCGASAGASGAYTAYIDSGTRLWRTFFI